MGEMADKLRAVEVRGTSPDGMITAVVSDQGDRITARMRRDAYHGYTENTLAHQLSRLCTVTWSRYQRAVSAAIRSVVPDVITDDAIEFGPEHRQYRQRLEQLTAEAVSPDGAVTVRSRSLLHWEFDIAHGTLHGLSEAEFLTQAGTAVRRLITDYRARVIRLRGEVYPSDFRERLQQHADRLRQARDRRV